MFVPALVLVALAACAVVHMPGRSHAGPLPPLSPGQSAAQQRLAADVQYLAGTLGERSVRRPRALETAATHIEQILTDLGYRVARHEYDVDDLRVRSIEATMPGAARPEEIVLFGAHYDSVRGTPGANDNASGVAALLELARQFAGKPQPRTVRFVAFVNEEPPFFNIGEMGSQFYARDAIARGDRIVAMLSLETLGCYSDEPGSQQYPFPFGLLYPDRGDFVAFVGNFGSRALVRRSVATFREAAAFPSEGVAAPSFIPGVYWSDHASFWPYEVPALMVTDTAPFRYAEYHTEGDVPEQVDAERLARVVDGLVAVGKALAEGD
jgi:hypothetical protein